MQLSSSVRVLLLATCFLYTCDAHLCLISPRQRGDMDISSSGSHTCFRHGAPCGGMPAAAPTGGPLIAGQQMFMKWQQNFNHYEVGYPGFMDISIAPVNSDNFTLLAFVPDKYVFAQDHQENYTAVVVIPSTPCDHCVIRARYQPHKPGETTFYQCADVRVTHISNHIHNRLYESAPLDPNFRTVRKAMEHQQKYPIQHEMDSKFNLQGLAYNEFDPDRLHFVNVSLDTGHVQPLNSLTLGVDSPGKASNVAAPSKNFLMDGITALNPGQSEMLTIYHHGGPMDEIAKEILVFFTNNGTVELTTPLSGFDGVPISSFLYVKPRTYVTFGLQENPTVAGAFFFIMGQINYVPGTGLVYKQIYKGGTENLYINYQWASFDPVSGLLHVLMGNENDPDKLSARIYTFSFANQSFVKMVQIQPSISTFMVMQTFRPSPQIAYLYALAPDGLYSDKRPAWSLIQINPLTGAVTSLFQIAPEGLFERYYGGSIFNGLDQTSGALYHVLRVADTVADVIVRVNIREMTVGFSQLANLRHIHNLSLSPN